MARKKRPVEMCKLCETERPLCKSHIVPEMCYRPFYDEKSRALMLDPSEMGKPKFVQSGLKEYMLCEDCEALINKNYETVFRDQWLTPKRYNELGDKPVAVLDGFSYTEFKLFHLSVLLRAHFSKVFWEVQLGDSHVNYLRQCILSGVAPGQDEYPVIAALISDSTGKVWDDMVGSAHRFRMDGYWGYQFAFSGCQWYYFVSSHGRTPLADLAIRENGEVPVGKLPWLAFQRIYRPEYQKRKRGQEG